MQESGSLELSRVALVSHAMRFCLVWTRFVLPPCLWISFRSTYCLQGRPGYFGTGTPWITANFTHQTTFFLRSFLVQCLFLTNQVYHFHIKHYLFQVVSCPVFVSEQPSLISCSGYKWRICTLSRGIFRSLTPPKPSCQYILGCLEPLFACKNKQ